MKLHQVRLIGLPVALHQRIAEHIDAVRRELALIEAADDQSVPARLRALSERLEAEYSGFTSAQRSQLDEAIQDGVERIDLTYELPASVVEGAEELGQMLDELDDYCRSGDLVSLVTSPDLVTYRRWFLDQFIHQLRDGSAPVPWAGAEGAEPGAAAGSRQSAGSGEGGATAVVEVHGDLDLQGASALRSVVAARFDEGHRSVVFDLADCNFVDSVGLSLLLTTRNRCLEAGGEIRVENPGRFVLGTLRHAGVLELLVPPEHRDGQPQG